MTSLDTAAIMAEHKQSAGVFPEGFTPGCMACEWSDWPCLPYQLAEVLKAEQEKVLRVELQARIYALKGWTSVAETFRRAIAAPEQRRVHPDFLLDPEEDAPDA